MAQLNAAVVSLVAADRPNSAGILPVYCTGTFISRTEVLTAAHCVEGDTQVSLATYSAYVDSNSVITEDTRLLQFSVSHRDEDSDLALLSAQAGAYVPPHQLVRISSGPPLQGEKVLLLGHARGLPWSLTAGVVSSAHRVGWARSTPDKSPLFIQHDASASRGNSGGPLLNYKNELIGVLVQGARGEGHLSMSVHTNVVHEFLRGLR